MHVIATVAGDTFGRNFLRIHRTLVATDAFYLAVLVPQRELRFPVVVEVAGLPIL